MAPVVAAFATLAAGLAAEHAAALDGFRVAPVARGRGWTVERWAITGGWTRVARYGSNREARAAMAALAWAEVTS